MVHPPPVSSLIPAQICVLCGYIPLSASKDTSMYFHSQKAASTCRSCWLDWLVCFTVYIISHNREVWIIANHYKLVSQALKCLMPMRKPNQSFWKWAPSIKFFFLTIRKSIWHLSLKPYVLPLKVKPVEYLLEFTHWFATLHLYSPSLSSELITKLNSGRELWQH